MTSKGYGYGCMHSRASFLYIWPLFFEAQNSYIIVPYIRKHLWFEVFYSNIWHNTAVWVFPSTRACSRFIISNRSTPQVIEEYFLCVHTSELLWSESYREYSHLILCHRRRAQTKHLTDTEAYRLAKIRNFSPNLWARISEKNQRFDSRKVW